MSRTEQADDRDRMAGRDNPENHGSHDSNGPDQQREYERSGLYPEEGKPFRVFALLGVIFLVMIFMAGAAALVDWLVDY